VAAASLNKLSHETSDQRKQQNRRS
jgi:hypothetical protein